MTSDERDPGHGVAVWSTAQWRGRAVAWMDERLAEAGAHRTGDAQQPHLRPWATALRAPTSCGPVWLKAASPGTAFEAALYPLLARAVPDRVLTPLGIDAEAGWMLLPDGGPTLGGSLEGVRRAEALADAVVEYGRLQRELVPLEGDLLAAGVADMRPAAMPARLDEALAAVGGDPAVAARRSDVVTWCERLAASPIPASLDHNDLHPWNVLDDGSGRVRFYDWGDAVVAHPFAAMLVPLGMIRSGLGATPEDPRLARARDRYLEVFSDLAPPPELVETLELACRVAKIARALIWDRALSAARDQGEDIRPDFAAAPARTLASLLDPSHLGGA